MNRNEYLTKISKLLNDEKISAEVYDSMIMNIDIFIEPEDNSGLPNRYCEIQYDDFDNAEAIDGAKWDDMNFLHYTER